MFLVMTSHADSRGPLLCAIRRYDVSVLERKSRPAGKTHRTALNRETRMEEVVTRCARDKRGATVPYWVCPLVEESEVTI